MVRSEIDVSVALGRVEWRDLVALRPLEVARELLLPLPWLAASLFFAEIRFYPVAVICSFVFFLTGLRIVHGACHYALGLPRRVNEWVLFAFSPLMLGSMHAVQWNHLRHHRYCLAEHDVEAMGARRSAWGAILLGPRFPLFLHRAALTGARVRQRRWIWAELTTNLAPVVIAAIWPCRASAYHLAVMAIGQCLTAFFAVWTVHHDCVTAYPAARTIRNSLRNAVTFNMFFHVEHHLFPRVPTPHLPALARRLDQAMVHPDWLLVW